MPTISEALSIALQQKQAGQIQAAQQICGQILAADPNNAAALHLLGVIALEFGRPNLAVQHISRAIQSNPSEPVFYANLGNAYQAQTRLDEAVACFRKALNLNPSEAVIHFNLGNAFLAQGKLQGAINAYSKAVELKPDLAPAHHNLGRCYQVQGWLQPAIACFRQTLQLAPHMAEAHNSLGNAFCVQGDLGDAIPCYRRALELKPDYAEAHSNLAIALQGQGQLADAVECCRRAIALQPNYVAAYNNLGDAWLAQGNFENAIAAYRQGLRLNSGLDQPHAGQATAFHHWARFDDALSGYASAIDPREGYPYAIRFVSTRDSDDDRRETELDIPGQEEHHCRLISTHGILKSCDVHPRHPTSVRAFPHAEYPSDWMDNLRPGQSIYVCTSAMADFVANVFPRLASSGPPFVLVTGDADELAPVDLFPSAAAAAQFLDSPHVLAWFAQNCVVQHPKLVPIPIGLDYHTITNGGVPWWGPKMTPVQQEAELLAIRHSPSAVRSPHRAYANFHFSLNKRFGNDRRAAIAQIPLDSVDYEPRNTPRLQSWKQQRLEHRFVLSPAGTGLDCHRTWEALCLGCVPIVRTSPLDVLWEGLDVWILNSWSEVNADSMARKAVEVDAAATAARQNTEIPAKLLLQTWLNKIRRAGAGPANPLVG